MFRRNLTHRQVIAPWQRVFSLLLYGAFVLGCSKTPRIAYEDRSDLLRPEYRLVALDQVENRRAKRCIARVESSADGVTPKFVDLDPDGDLTGIIAELPSEARAREYAALLRRLKVFRKVAKGTEMIYLSEGLSGEGMYNKADADRWGVCETVSEKDGWTFCSVLSRNALETQSGQVEIVMVREHIGRFGKYALEWERIVETGQRAKQYQMVTTD